MRGRRNRISCRGSVAAVAVAALCAAAIAPGAAAAEAPLLGNFCPTGSAGGECTIPRGIGVNASSGDLYLADQENKRIEQFTPWGEFVRAWGWDVVASGPGDDTTPPEDQFEVCEPPEDTCKGGLSGGGPGALDGHQGVAVDSAGAVYVVDWTNHRVQKFGPEGQFLLMFGGGVEQGPNHPGNLCTAAFIAEGDTCGAGSEGAGPGQFGFWRLGSYIAVDTRQTAEASDDTIYVGDQGRVQEFDPGGHHSGDLPDPEGILAAGGTVNSLAVDPASGELYLGFFRDVSSPQSKPDVFKLDAGGEEQCTIEAHNPRAVAVGPEGEVYLVDGEIFKTPPTPREVVRLDADCGGREALLSSEVGHEGDRFSADPTGIAASGACRSEAEADVDLAIANPDEANSYVKLFGAPPNGALCPPPPAPPLITDEFAASVSPEGAVVRAKINPRYWPDTTYRVQYATAACLGEGEDWEAECVAGQPAGGAGLLLSEATTSSILTTKGVLLGASVPLVPDTAYRYRFLAESGGGGPVHGAGGGFHTPPPPAPGKADCPNGAYRGGAAAALPDCRAYEMVSPPEKNNGEIGAPQGGFLDQAAPGGEALTFGTNNAFGELEGAPFVGQYLAERGAGGWSTRSLNAPRKDVGLIYAENLATRFKAFDANLCSGWLLQDTDVQLVEGAPAGVAGLYRRGGLRAGCGGPAGYELLSTVPPPGYQPTVEKTESLYNPEIQGSTADGRLSAFRAAAALSMDACKVPTSAGPEGKGIFQAYLVREGAPGTPPALLSVLPSGAPACTHSSLGTSQSTDAAFHTGDDALHHALSEDGSRAYWTATADGTPSSGYQGGYFPGKLYVRVNPEATQSPLAHGGARGVGDLPGAEGAGKVVSFGANKEKVTGLTLAPGSPPFAAGQEVGDSAEKLPAGTKVLASAIEKEEGGVTYYVLTVDHAATGSQNPDQILALSTATVSGLSVAGPSGFGAFEEGQSLSGPGIAAGTTVLACAPECGAAATSLTLSAQASTGEGVGLEGSSACTEAVTRACTLPVSEEGEAGSGGGASRFLEASADGSVAFYLVESQSGETELYEYDLAKALAGEAASSRIAGGAAGIMGSSEDGSLLYLLSTEDLAAGATADKPNLYLRRRGEAPVFIATLGGPDDASVGEGSRPGSAIARFARKRASRVSPDGLHAAFASADPALAQSVADYDNTDAASGEADREIYLYDAAEGSLTCVSCNPSGARPTGRADENGVWEAARLPGWDTALVPGGALSTDGRRLFLESFEPLLARDGNGRADVYEWERLAGSGAAAREECLNQIGGARYIPPASEAAAPGCLSLISTGTADSDSRLIDASADGSDVFILTDAPLVGADTDQFADIYDARALGGFPESPPPAPECQGEACQSPPPAPEAKTPGSASFQGPGNVSPPAAGRCAKPARLGAALSRRARGLRGAARRLAHRGEARRARRLRHRAHRYAKTARVQSAHAKRCRARERRRASR